MNLDLSSPTITFDLASRILDCVKATLDEQCGDSTPARSCVIVGVPAQDDCCEGQLTVGITRVASSTSFPFEDQGGRTPCNNSSLLVYMDVSLFRCVPTVEDDGEAPDCELLTQSAQQIYFEGRIVWNAVQCCLKDGYTFGIDSTIVGQDTSDPQGGCGGTVLHLIVGIPDGCGCS